MVFLPNCGQIIVMKLRLRNASLAPGSKCKERVAELSATLEEDAKKEEEAKEARKRPLPPPSKPQAPLPAPLPPPVRIILF